MKAIIEDREGNKTVMVGPLEALRALCDHAENNGGRVVKLEPDWREQVAERQALKEAAAA